MKIRTVIYSILVALCIVACSKEDKPALKQPRLVPITVAELESSADFKLDYTTKGGIKFYVRFLDPKVADSITEDSPDYEFMHGGSTQYLIAAVYNGSVVSSDSLDSRLRTPDGQYTSEGEELFKYAFKSMARDSAADLEELKREAAP